MAKNIGRVEFLVGLDGKLMPAQARKIGQSVGRTLGKETGKEFDSEFDRSLTTYGRRWASRMRRNGQLAGISFGDALRAQISSKLDKLTIEMAEVFGDKSGIQKFTERIGNSGEAIELLRNNVARLNEENRISNQMYSGLIKKIDAYEKGVVRTREETARLGLVQSEHVLNLGRLERALDRVKESRDRMRLKDVNDDLDVQLRTQLGLEGSLGRSARNMGRLDGRSRDFLSRWKKMPHGLRQFLLIGALIVSIGEAVAVLGSAAGSSLTVLAAALARLASAASASLVVTVGALAAGATGVGVLVAGMIGLTKEIDKLPPALRPAARAVEALGKRFSELRGLIQRRIFVGLEGDISRLTERLFPVLKDGILGIADVSRSFLEDLSARLSSDRGLQTVKTILDGMKETLSFLFPAILNIGSAFGSVWATAQPFIVDFARRLESLTGRFDDWTGSLEGQNAIAAWFERGRKVMDGFLDGVLDLGGALRTIFDAAGPSVDRFSGWLGRLLDNFNKWTKSVEGQNALAEWFSNLERIMPRVGKLLAATGKMLSGLVTEEAVQRMEGFLDHLSGAMEFVGNFLNVIGTLNILGLVAQILNEFGRALEPVLNLLRPIADILSTSLSNSLSGLAEVLQIVLIPLELLRIPFEIFNMLLQKLSEYIQPVIGVIGELVGILQDELGAVIDEVILPAVGELIDELFGLLPPGEDLADFLRTQLVPWVRDHLVPALRDWGERIADLVRGFKDDILPVLRDKVVPFVVNTLIPAIDNVVRAFNITIGIVSRLTRTFDPLIDALRWVAELLGIVKRDSGGLGRLSIGGRGGGGAGGGGISFASGGVVDRPTRAVVGDAGLEAMVPLRRALSRVHPSVRELSAFAQGLPTSSTSTTTKGITVMPGAITFTTRATNGSIVAKQVLDEIVANLP